MHEYCCSEINELFIPKPFSSSATRLDCKAHASTKPRSCSISTTIVNKVQLIGRVGADPSVTDIGDGRRVVNYTVATSETRPDKEGDVLHYV